MATQKHNYDQLGNWFENAFASLFWSLIFLVKFAFLLLTAGILVFIILLVDSKITNIIGAKYAPEEPVRARAEKGEGGKEDKTPRPENTMEATTIGTVIGLLAGSGHIIAVLWFWGYFSFLKLIICSIMSFSVLSFVFISSAAAIRAFTTWYRLSHEREGPEGADVDYVSLEPADSESDLRREKIHSSYS
jgi:hypothetical protein